MPADDVRRAEDYDRMVDWEKRLAREGPFFRSLFEERGVRSVLDVGCGSGKHAIMFASWGLEVAGADPSEAMLAQARENARESGADVTFVSAGFGELGGALAGTFDAVTCLGNALPHVGGVEGLHDALTD
ncbi:MAG: class I SAM-dependent methyltransferase, partial [Coriobacteriia bacterium]|nr:class I SAM-dependent methyltransferase [Coriobacteriia bacterium]